MDVHGYHQLSLNPLSPCCGEGSRKLKTLSCYRGHLHPYYTGRGDGLTSDFAPYPYVTKQKEKGSLVTLFFNGRLHSSLRHTRTQVSLYRP